MPDTDNAKLAHGHIQWEAIKLPEMRYWGFRDDLGFTFFSNDEDGWRTKRVVELLNKAEASLATRSGPKARRHSQNMRPNMRQRKPPRWHSR